jgi:hypothetical protein
LNNTVPSIVFKTRKRKINVDKGVEKMEQQEEVSVEREFSGFKVALTTGSRAKKARSNSMKIAVSGERTSVAVELTIREAEALKRFLNENLK